MDVDGPLSLTGVESSRNQQIITTDSIEVLRFDRCYQCLIMRSTDAKNDDKRMDHSNQRCLGCHRVFLETPTLQTLLLKIVKHEVTVTWLMFEQVSILEVRTSPLRTQFSLSRNKSRKKSSCRSDALVQANSSTKKLSHFISAIDLQI